MYTYLYQCLPHWTASQVASWHALNVNTKYMKSFVILTIKWNLYSARWPLNRYSHGDTSVKNARAPGRVNEIYALRVYTRALFGDLCILVTARLPRVMLHVPLSSFVFMCFARAQKWTGYTWKPHAQKRVWGHDQNVKIASPRGLCTRQSVLSSLDIDFCTGSLLSSKH